MRMLMNNLDPDVAERPEQLIVYGGMGKAARNWECFDAIVRELDRACAEAPLIVTTGGALVTAICGGASGHGDGQTREGGRESQRSGSSSHSAPLRRRRRSTLARQHEHHVFPIFGGRVRVYLTAPQSEKTSRLETSAAPRAGALTASRRGRDRLARRSFLPRRLLGRVDADREVPRVRRSFPVREHYRATRSS